MAIVQSPAAIAVTADLTGVANIAILVPGTFSGYPPADPANARYLKSVSFIADTIHLGDYVDSVTLEDTDGVIPAPARGAFPNYPVIVNFSTDTGIATGAKAGYYFDRSGNAMISVLTNDLVVLPSGLYLKATIHGITLGVYRVNVVWGKYLAS